MILDDTNKLLSLMNKLYWFKDQVDDQEDYLMTLLNISKELKFEGLEGDISKILEFNGRI